MRLASRDPLQAGGVGLGPRQLLSDLQTGDLNIKASREARSSDLGTVSLTDEGLWTLEATPWAAAGLSMGLPGGRPFPNKLSPWTPPPSPGSPGPLQGAPSLQLPCGPVALGTSFRVGGLVSGYPGLGSREDGPARAAAWPGCLPLQSRLSGRGCTAGWSWVVRSLGRRRKPLPQHQAYVF